MSGVGPATSAPLCPTTAVISSGTWGITFASPLAQIGTPTTTWAWRREVTKEINSDTDERCVPDHRLPQGLKVTTGLAQAVTGANIIIVAVPSQEARRVLGLLGGVPADNAVAVSLMKGIELGTGLCVNEVLAEALGIDSSRVVVVSGPNLADGIAAGQPTATVVTANDEQVTARIAPLYATDTFRPYTSTNVPGVELCGVVKNVITLAVSAVASRGLGDSSKAMIITQGLVEIIRLGLKLGTCPEIFSRLAGMGNLVATCSSPLSRNQAFSRHLNEGMSVAEAAAASRGVAEGAKSACAVLNLARAHGVDTPITAGVVTVVEGVISVARVTDALLVRPRKSEGVHTAPSQA